MTLFADEIHHQAAQAREVFDVSGQEIPSLRPWR
jgi:bifunctional ADP-heptose synthase (sugar kinase/adenylyltransferase)